MIDESRMTAGQREALERFRRFIAGEREAVFILRGYAGTGKTTLLRAFVDYVDAAGIYRELTATTGRAAKMLTLRTGLEAKTLHSLIYRFADYGASLSRLLSGEEREALAEEEDEELLSLYSLSELSEEVQASSRRIYFVDEASMISDRARRGGRLRFGSGNLLEDLFRYDPAGKFVFVGDDSQLPPVGQEFSPALEPAYLEEQYGMRVTGYSLTEIVRQADRSGIVTAAAELRQLYLDPPEERWGYLPLSGYDDILFAPDSEALVDEYLDRIDEGEAGQTTFIARTNKRCTEVSLLARERLGFINPVEEGELLLVTRNRFRLGLANGDLVEPLAVRLDRSEERAGLTFVPILLRHPETGEEQELLMILDLLLSDTPELPMESQKALIRDFAIRMKQQGVKQRSDAFHREMRLDPYLNALHCRYGYALTCHKAQGGEWDEVFVDLPVWVLKGAAAEGYRWAYTALTRARSVAHFARTFLIR